MAIIRPFRGITYNPSRVTLDDVVAPPYDVISPEQQERLYDRSPYNVVRLILGRETDRYAAAAKHYQQWLTERILLRDDKPAIYVLHQTFYGNSEKPITRKGFIALCRLEEFKNKIILPHERTLARPREDRLKLIKATHANFSQVFSLYSDSGKRIEALVNGIARTSPALEVNFENVENRVWKLQDATTITDIQSFFSDKQVLIADGHHRYETALAYRDLMRSKNRRHTGNELYNYVMMFFTNIEDEGLLIYPTQRIVHSLKNFDAKKFFELVEQSFIIHEFRDGDSLRMGLESTHARSFGVVLNDDPSFYLLTLKPTTAVQDLVHDPLPNEVKELDVTLLHSAVLRDVLGISAEAQEQKLNLDYSKSFGEAVERARSGKAQLAFLMKPTKIEEVRRVANAGYTMPQKSTYFFPKLLSGLVLNTMTE